MTTAKYDIPAILALPVEKNDRQVTTVGQYVATSTRKNLLNTYFSPSERVSWRNPILAALVKAQIITGTLQKDGSLYNASEAQGQEVLEAIGEYLIKADYSALPEAPVIKEWYVVDFDKTYGSNEITLQEIISGPHTEEEARKIRKEAYSTGAYEFSSYVLHIPVPTDLPKKA